MAGTVFVIALPTVMLAAAVGAPAVRWARRRRFARQARQSISFITRPGGVSVLARTVRQ